MPLEAAGQTYEIGDEALQAAVFSDTWCGVAY